MKNKLLSGSLILTFSEASKKVIGFLLLPVLTNYLVPSEYGILAVVLLIISFLNIIYNPGVVSATMRLYYDFDEEREKKLVVGSALILVITIAFVFTFLLSFIGKDISDNLFNEFPFYPYGIYAIIIAFFSQTVRIWNLLFRIQNRIKPIAVVTIISTLLSLGLSYYLVVFANMGVDGRLIGMLVSSFILFAYSSYSILAYTGFKYSFSYMKKIINLGYPLIFGIVAYSILSIGDRFIIERFLGLNDLGVYETSYKLGSIALFLSIGFKKMWTPYFYENVKTKISLEGTVKNIIVVITLIVATQLVFLPELYYVLIGEKYWVGIVYVPFISIGVYGALLTIISQGILSYEKKFKLISLSMSIAAVINILINIIFINTFGLFASASAVLVAYLFELFFAIILVKNSQLLKIPILYLVIGLLTLFCSSSFVFIQRVDFTWTILFAKVIIFLIIFFITLVKYYGIKKIKFTLTRITTLYK